MNRLVTAILLGTALFGCETTEYRVPARPATRASAEPARGAIAPGELIIEPWSFGDINGELITTSTHRLHMTIPPGRLRDETPRFMETALDHYRSMITMGTEASEKLPSPPERLNIFLFADRDDWADWTRQRLGRDARLYLSIERGGYTYDSESVLFDIGRYDTLCILAHEGWHQYTQSYFPHPLPVWIEEGLATYAEGHRFRRSDRMPVFMPWRNLERFGQLRMSRSRGELIPLEKLLDQPPQSFVALGEQQLLTYYAQVWLLIHYLQEGNGGKYREGLARLVQDAAYGRVATSLYDASQTAGRRGIAANPDIADVFIAAYFDEDVEAFKIGYTDFLELVISSGNGMHIWRGISPVNPENSPVVN